MKCEFCGSDMPRYCDGIQVWGEDPYSAELYGDEEEYLMCRGQRYNSAMDI